MKKIIIPAILLTLAISFSYNIAYIPEIDTSSIGYDNVSCVNLFGDTNLYNPATLSFAKDYKVSFSYYDYLDLGLFNLQQFYFKQPIKNGFAGLLAIQRTYSKDSNTNFDNWIYDYRFSSISNNISLGMSLKYITLSSFYYSNEASSVSYLTGDLGIITKFGDFALGGVAKNVLTYKFNSYAIDVSPEYVFGLNYANKIFSMETSLGKNFNSPSMWGGVSLAMKIANLLLKGGITANTDFKSAHLKDAAFGMNVKISNISIDYAFKIYFSHINSIYLQSNYLTFSFVW